MGDLVASVSYEFNTNEELNEVSLKVRWLITNYRYEEITIYLLCNCFILVADRTYWRLINIFDYQIYIY